MKSIENRTTEIINVDDQGNRLGQCKYSHLIQLVIKRGKQTGFDWNDIDNRIAIQKSIDGHPDIIQLEDSYFTYLKKLVETMTWAFFHEDLVAFKTDLTSIK